MCLTDLVPLWLNFLQYLRENVSLPKREKYKKCFQARHLANDYLKQFTCHETNYFNSINVYMIHLISFSYG